MNITKEETAALLVFGFLFAWLWIDLEKQKQEIENLHELVVVQRVSSAKRSIEHREIEESLERRIIFLTDAMAKESIRGNR